MSERNSYSNIIKATTLFGGVKVIQILITIIRTKFIAILLGPSGMGISGMITATLEIIGSLVGFGLGTSGVKDVSQAFTSGNVLRKNTIITILRKIVIITGLIGTFITFIFAPSLSVITFGSDEYTIAFRIVSITLLFNQVNIGFTVLLQGTFRYSEIAKSALIGSFLGLLLTVPLYYIWGIGAIIPAIIISSAVQLLLSWFFARKIEYTKVFLSIKETYIHGKGMISLGFVIAFTGFATQGAAYLLKIFISRYGQISEVGLYTAGVGMVSSYVGIVLNAMSTDYAPRISSIASNNTELIEVINKQIILLITILAPLILIFMVFIKYLVLLFYTKEFVITTNMIEWVLLGMFFRAISWALSFSFVARGDSKIFFWNELAANFYSLLFSITGYFFWGIEGLGIGYFLTYIVYSIHMFYLARSRFKFIFNPYFIKIFIFQLIVLVVSFLLSKFLGFVIYRYLLNSILICLIFWFSIKNLNKMINLPVMVENLFIKFLPQKK